MGSGDDVKRPRIAADIEPEKLKEVITAVQERRYESPREFYIDAVDRLLYRPLRFSTSRDMTILAGCLERANDLIMLGVTLSALHEEPIHRIIMQKAEACVPMAFMLLDPNLSQDDRIFHATDGDPDVILKEARRTFDFLCALQRENHARVKIAISTLDFIPPAGMTISNPYDSERTEAIGAIYLFDNQSGQHISLIANKRSDDGRAACTAFLKHYTQLLTRAKNYPPC